MSSIPTITTTEAPTEAPAAPANVNPSHAHATSPSPRALPIEYTNFPPPIPENSLPTWSIVIEFCDRCRWLHRATWMQTELFVTFGEKKDSPAGEASIQSITLLPMTRDETAGRFRVWLYGQKGPGGASSTGPKSTTQGSRALCVYDRKVKGGFPELKELKQIIRDVISPSQNLGHSDVKGVSGTGHEPNTGTASVASAHG